jgi:hypothetical protein
VRDPLSILGLSSSERVIQDLLKESGLTDAPRIKVGDIEARFAVKTKGFDLNFVPAQLFDAGRPATDIVLGNIVFFGPEYAKYAYEPQAELPLGLSFAMTREQAVVALGAPVQSWESDGFVRSQRWSVQQRNVSIQYSKLSATIKSVEFSLPKPTA